MIDPKTRLQRNSDVVQASLGENSIVVMSLAQASYFGMEEPASTIWELLQEERSFESLVKALAESYDVPPDQCEQDTRKFLSQLVDKDLVRIIRGTAD